MPIPEYQLDDLDFKDRVAEMKARIPAHTPEWTNPQEGDPGHTLIDLFAWLGHTLLYRVNLIPERQRLEFLRLLNIPMIRARAATGLVALEAAGGERVVRVPRFTPVKGPVDFETTQEVTVFPFKGQVYVKRKPTLEETAGFSAIQMELEEIYDIEEASPYVTTPLFETIPSDRPFIDIAGETIDQRLWIALMAGPGFEAARLLDSFDSDDLGEKILTIGFAPRTPVPVFDEEVTRPVDMTEFWQWEMPSSRPGKDEAPHEIPYLTLDVREDTTCGFTRQGIIRLALPAKAQVALPENNVDQNIYAGTGGFPPRIDREEDARRLVTWIRLSPRQESLGLAVEWLGINAVSVDQCRTVRDTIIGVSDGRADQVLELSGSHVDPDSFELEVEAPGRGYEAWRNQLLYTAKGDAPVYELDPEAGILKLGDGMRGAVPRAGARIRVKTMRAGGGKKGNLAPGNLTSIAYPDLKLAQPVATTGGVEAETLDEAEKRIPEVLAHGNRAVTLADYKNLAARTPGIVPGRVEVLPRFKPQQRQKNIPGVVTVMVLPKARSRSVPNPRPDRNMLSRIHAHLDSARPIGVELYVIGAEYIELGLAVAVNLNQGVQKNQVMQDIRDGLKTFLWPLAPGGHQKKGWQLGRAVVNHELEVIIARVSGVLTVNQVNLFQKNGAGKWESIGDAGVQRLGLAHWQLPELTRVAVAEGSQASGDLNLDGTETGRDDGSGGIPIPVVPGSCQ